MNKNILFVALILIIVLETGFIAYREFSKPKVTLTANSLGSSSNKPNLPPAGPNAKGQGPVLLSKGMNLKTTPLFKYAYQIAPGTLSSSAKEALVGWSITSTTQTDGSISVSLTPKDSQDQSQQYLVKSGQTLYFIEQTPFDDKVDQDRDLNYRDDYGIIVDQNGIIQ